MVMTWQLEVVGSIPSPAEVGERYELNVKK